MLPVDRRRIETVTCMHCGNGEAKLLPRVCNRADYSCRSCGDYSVSGTMEMIIKNGHADPRLARIVAENGRRYLRPSRQ
jgi:hypothetical protein